MFYFRMKNFDLKKKNDLNPSNKKDTVQIFFVRLMKNGYFT